jgi:Tol biopolymer transport system component
MENQFKQLLEMHQKLIQSLKCEIWRNIDGYDNYAVSNHGRIKNLNTGRILTGQLTKYGYLSIGLYKTNKFKKFLIHRLVTIAFLCNPEKKEQVDHIDSDRTNNNINNLRWATNGENRRNTPAQHNTSSNIKGVSWHKKTKKWQSRITIDGKQICLGFFVDIEDAKQARINKANQIFGKFIHRSEKL